MRRKALWMLSAAFLAGAGVPLAIVLPAWLKYKRLESAIVDKMDQYYLNITTPGREEYLLSDDEVFHVPYMASQLSVEAAPTRLYDGAGTLIGEFIEARGQYVRSEKDLPDFLKKAVVAAEDGGFYRHGGINWRAVVRAILMNIRRGRIVQGGSTLTRQLAKIIFTMHERTFSRHAFAYFCALKLEEKFTKDQILLMYLNFIYLGHGCYGVECAAQFYFGKPASALELGESAMLAGIIANPNNYSPFMKLEYTKARHRTVLRRMAAHGFIPESALERYSKEFWDAMEKRLEAPEASIRPMRVNRAPYFVEFVRQTLEAELGRTRLLKGGLKVYTTLDLGMQNAARDALRAGLDEERRIAQERRKPYEGIEGGFAALDPRDGAVRALIGGSGFTYKNQFNRGANGRRPVGSAIKPFIYAAAFDDGGHEPQEMFIDAKASYPEGGGRKWTPRNYGGKYYGEVTLAAALVKSLNTVAVKLLAASDIDRVRALLAAVSLAPAGAFPRDLTLALGSAGLTPLELAASYAVFANGGRPVRPYAVARIEDRDGRTVREWKPAEMDPVISTTTCRAVRKILEEVLRPGGTAYAAARRSGFTLPAAGKTGTTNDYRDAWFAGVTPDIAAAVRVGHDDMRLPLGPGRSGGSVAAPIWMSFVKGVYRNRPARGFDERIVPGRSGRGETDIVESSP